MVPKDLFVYVDNDDQCANRLTYAVQVAQHYNAHLSGVYVKRQLGLPSYADAQVPEDILAAGEQRLTEMAAEARKAFQNGVSNLELAAEYHQLKGVLPDVLARTLRFSDLCVLAQRDPEQNLNAHYKPDQLLFLTGRPALIVPRTGQHSFPPRRAVVAWNASAPSARAVHDALPLLAAAAEVLVITVGDDPHSTVANGSLTTHLDRLGLQVEIRKIAAADREAPEAILAAANETDCELLVMGGYGHTRLRELVLGGVTRHVLAHMTVPVLMSH